MRPRNDWKLWQALPAITLSVGIGYVVVRIFAAGLAASFIVSGATVSSNAAVVSNSAAIGGKMVKFGVTPSATPAPTASPTPTPTPSPTPTSNVKPSATNTGVPAGVSLAIISGDQTYTASSNGATITGKDFRGFVRVTGANITFKNCIFRGRAITSNKALFDTESSTGTITVQDSEFSPSNPSATIDGLWLKNTNVYRANIHGAVDGIKADSNTLVQDSYIHDLSSFASDPNQGGGSTHNDAIQILSGSSIYITHNNLNMTSSNNAAIQITQDFGAVSGVYISSNWADGGGCTYNIAHDVRPSLTGIYITNNRFGRNSYYNCPILISTQTTLSQNAGNVWDNNGAAIPPPQQHD